MLAICILSPGNADLERSFSTNKYLLAVHAGSTSEETIQAVHFVKDFINLNYGECQNIEDDVDRMLTFMPEMEGRSAGGERKEKKGTNQKRRQNSKENARRKNKKKRNK